MKFATALLALATAAMAIPTKFALEERHNSCKTCDWEHHKNGWGRHKGSERPCSNWVPVTEELIVLDIHAEICLKREAVDHGLLVSDTSVKIDVEIDIVFLQQKYPAYSHLYCDPKSKSKPVRCSSFDAQSQLNTDPIFRARESLWTIAGSTSLKRTIPSRETIKARSWPARSVALWISSCTQHGC